MGLAISKLCFHGRIEEDCCFSDKKYKRFYSKNGYQPYQVVMQLTGDGFAGGTSPFHVNEHVSVRYHYQFQCTFAPNDDSTIIYGKFRYFQTLKTIIFNSNIIVFSQLN